MLNKLSPADAEALLIAICPRIDDNAAHHIAYICSYQPLALRMFAALARDVDIPVGSGKLEEERIYQLSEPRYHADIETASVLAVAALSYAALPDDAQQVFAQLGVFAGSFDLSAALVVIGYPLYLMPDGLTDMLGLLVRRSLLDYDPATARYRQHELLRDYALTLLTPATALQRPA